MFKNLKQEGVFKSLVTSLRCGEDKNVFALWKEGIKKVFLDITSHSVIKKTDLRCHQSHVKKLLYHHVLLRKIYEQLKNIPFQCSVLQ